MNVKLYSVEEVHARMDALGMKIPDFHIVGIRSVEDAPDKFDDLMMLIYKLGGQWVCHYYSCTTNPGVHWLQNFANPKGSGILKSDQQCFNAYQIGKHKGMYDALVQVREVTVFRDTDKDMKAEETGVLDTGLFGLNIHHANKDLVSVVVGKWSAACQVLNNPKDFAQLMQLCKESSQRFFTYTLLKEW